MNFAPTLVHKLRLLLFFLNEIFNIFSHILEFYAKIWDNVFVSLQANFVILMVFY